VLRFWNLKFDSGFKVPFLSNCEQFTKLGKEPGESDGGDSANERKLSKHYFRKGFL